MSASPLLYQVPPALSGWRRWLLSPLARMIWFVAIVALMLWLLSLLGRERIAGNPAAWARVLVLVPQALVPCLAYWLLVRLIERRRLAELAPRDLLPGIARGFVAGVLLFSAIVAILSVLGVYHIEGFNTQLDWLRGLGVYGFGAALGEEIVFRGVLFRLVEEGLGSRWSLLISALFFGAAHAGNPGASIWSSVAIAVEAGLLIALVFQYTRSLFPCIGLHAGWNISQGLLWGIPVSGTQAGGLLISSRSGPQWLSGGDFGAEASLPAIAIGLLAGLWLYRGIRRQAAEIAPAWRRRRAEPTIFVEAGGIPPTAG